MKKFLMTFFICLVLVFVFMFFGGSMLLDLSRHFYAFLVFISLALAVLVTVLEGLWEKLESLEKRVQELEGRENPPEEQIQSLENRKDLRDKENNR